MATPTLTRPEGSEPKDFDVSRRGVAGLFFAGYAAFAASADAAPIHTDDAGLITAEVMLPGQDRPVPAYLARPNQPGRFGTIVVVSEVFGVHEYIRDVCRRLAKLGYVALAPDFFFRAGDPAPLTDFNEIREIVAQASDAQTMGDLDAALMYLKSQPFVNRERIGITGFCWGGALVWLACERFKSFRAGVAWYGRLTRPKAGEFLSEPERQWPLELAHELKAPVLGLYAGKDQGIPAEAIQAMRDTLAANNFLQSGIIVYPEAQHGFHADYRSSYDEAAAKDAWVQMLTHFARYGVTPGAAAGRRGLMPF